MRELRPHSQLLSALLLDRPRQHPPLPSPAPDAVRLPPGWQGVYSIALKTISKVYVIAIKIGGYMLFTSIGGWVAFGESSKGRVLPTLGIATGVVLMSI
jgi:hypothetical protein